MARAYSKRFEWERHVMATDLPPAIKLTAMTLATFVNGSGEHAHPGVDRLAAATGYSRRTVMNHLVLLRDVGLLERARRGSRGGGRTSDEYVLVVPEDNPTRDP